MRKNTKELVGKKYNMLTVLKCLGLRHRKNIKKTDTWYLCQCDCGFEKEAMYSDLTNGNIKSCGCIVAINSRKTIKFAHDANRLPKGEAEFNSLCNTYKSMAIKRKLEWKLNKEECKKIFKDNCFYCNRIPSQISYHKHNNGNYIYNGIDRVNNKIGYNVKNVVTCCKDCNWMKSDMNVEDFKLHIKNIYEFLSLKEENDQD